MKDFKTLILTALNVVLVFLLFFQFSNLVRGQNQNPPLYAGQSLEQGVSGALVIATTTVQGKNKTLIFDELNGDIILNPASNVGVGTTTPLQRLTVNGNEDPLLGLTRSSTTSTIFRVGTDGAFVIQNQGVDNLIIKNGKVGIGTMMPTDTLSVGGSISAFGNIAGSFAPLDSSSFNLKLGARESGGHTGLYLFVTNSSCLISGAVQVGTINGVQLCIKDY